MLLQVSSPATQGSGSVPSSGTLQAQPLHADTFTDVLASVAAQWTPSDARQADQLWTSQPEAQWTSSLPEPSPFREDASAHGSAHGGNYYHQVIPSIQENKNIPGSYSALRTGMLRSLKVNCKETVLSFAAASLSQDLQYVTCCKQMACHKRQ